MGATYIRLSLSLTLCYIGTHVHNITLRCQPFLIFSLFLTDTKVRRVLVCLAFCYRKNESVLSVRRVMRHLVIHSGSCDCLSPSVKLWLLHHRNSPAHTPLLVRNVLPIFTRLGPLRLFPVSKTEETHERTEICYDLGDKTASLEDHKTLPKSAYQKCFEDWKKPSHNCIIYEGD